MVFSSFIEMIERNKIILPPLSGYTDYPYRCILSLFHPPCTCTEMVNARAIIEDNKKTLKMICQEPGDHPKGAQLIGNDPMIMRKAAKILEEKGFGYIDINMGCTVKKVVRKGQGVALMKHEYLARTIVKQVCSNVDIPVTVKMRTGFSEKQINVMSLSKQLEAEGVSAIIIHGRSGDKKFGKNVDYTSIQSVAATVDIPVIVNGGIIETNALEILEKTNATAVMPGRSLIGNPWIIDQIRDSLSNRKIYYPSLHEKKQIIEKHLTLESQCYGEYSAVRQFRTILPRYFRYCKNLNGLKNKIKETESLSDILYLIDRIEADTDMIYFQ